MSAEFSPGEHPQHLCPRSREAVDAMVENGFEIEALAPDHKQRCGNLKDLLDKLKSHPVPCCCADESVQRTMARIAAAGNATRYELCEADADALELLVAHGWDPRRVPSAMRPRAEHQAAMLALLDASSAESSSADRLVKATLDRITSDTSNQSVRMRIHEPVAARRSLRLADLGAIAALFVVAVSVAWPALSSARQRSQQAACFGSLGSIGSAVGRYGLDNRSSLPMASPSLAGSTWWNVGRPEQSNSANLFTLARTGFIKAQLMSCSGNAAAKSCRFEQDCQDWSCADQVSYSYQNLFARKRPTLDDPSKFVVLADKNPCVVRALRGERVIYVNENSPNHAGRGQNVLFSDGHALWSESPVLESGDNVWLPRSIERLIDAARGGRSASQTGPLKGVEEPEDADAFVCP